MRARRRAINASTSKLSPGRAARKRSRPARSGDWTSVRKRLSTSAAVAEIASRTAWTAAGADAEELTRAYAHVSEANFHAAAQGLTDDEGLDPVGPA